MFYNLLLPPFWKAPRLSVLDHQLVEASPEHPCVICIPYPLISDQNLEMSRPNSQLVTLQKHFSQLGLLESA